MKKVLKTWQWNGLFVLLFLTMAWAYGSFKTMDRGPYSRHQWRQADCVSITANYAQHDLPFLEPQVHQQNQEKPGKTISEMPLVYYGMGTLWSWFGTQYWMYRLLGFAIVGIGLFYLKQTLERILDDPFWAILVALFLFTSPILAYYANNFLMNPFGLGLALIGSAHLYRYSTEKKYKYLIYGSLLFLFAGLLKITALFLFFAFAGVVFIRFLRKKIAFRELIKMAIPFFLTLLIIFLWLRYVNEYNSNNLANIFLQGILPIWDISDTQRALIWGKFWSEIFPEAYGKITFAVLAGTVGLVLVNIKKANLKILLLTGFVLCGILAYFILFYQVFDVHEYYLTNLLVVGPLILLLGLDVIKKQYPEVFTSKTSKIIALFAFLFCVYYAAVNTRIKYDAGSRLSRNSFLISEEKQAYWNYYHWDYCNTFKDLETIDPYLTSIGCGPSKKVVSIPDQSINITLYLMNRKGYTDYGNNNYHGAERIEMAKKWGAEYLVVNRKELLSEPYLQPFLKNKVGETANVSIYRL